MQSPTAESILYGRTDARDARRQQKKMQQLNEELHQRFKDAQAKMPHPRVIDGYCVEEHILYDMLDEKDFARQCFIDGLDPGFKNIPALNFQVLFGWGALQHEFPNMRSGEDLMHAEMFISRYVRKLGFQLIGGNDPNNGDIIGFADLAVEEDEGFTMNFPIISGDLDLEDKGIRPVSWL